MTPSAKQLPAGAWYEPPKWVGDWESLRAQWPLDRSITFVNHGSFGACPTPVLDVQAALREELERDPMDFLERKIDPLIEAAIASVAGFLGARADDLVFVQNATTAVNTVLQSLELGPQDEVLVTDHTYSGVFNTVTEGALKRGYGVKVVHLGLDASDDEIVSAVQGSLGSRPKLAIIDHITSATAVVLPIERIVAACAAEGVMVMVDAAHTPGMFDTDLGKLRPDFWTGNLHKWVCAPKGCAVLYVREDRQEGIHPLVRSHAHLTPFTGEFAWTGTHDPTAFLSAPEAIHFFDALGWEKVRDYNSRLALYGSALIHEALGTRPVVPDRTSSSMALVVLPDNKGNTRESALAFRDELFRTHGIEVPVVAWGGIGALRISAHVYNRAEDYERLADVLPKAISGR
ncbi:MAG: aminotransferase class V-fold PLP-dependent enzyme [Actinomycetota bacterium]|nr:aminotransferase class V-fold PLP-dependent enzyme [Actinomycetota bacterium]